jgi:hypothetical protein
LRDFPNAPEPKLVEDIVVLTKGRECWPEGQPKKAFAELADLVIATGPSGVPEQAREGSEYIVQLFLLALADSARAGAPQSGEAQAILIDVLLDRLSEDLKPLGDNVGVAATRAFRLAILLSANFTAILSREQRKRLFKLLEDLRQGGPVEYSDPFLHDFCIIYRNMDLERLEGLYDRDAS